MKRMDFFGFISAVYNDWISRMSGLASVAFVALGFIPHKKFRFFKNPIVQRKIFWGIALFCFFLASISAWTNEHQKVVSKTPNFSVDFSQYFVNPAGKHNENSLLTVSFLIASTGGASLIKDIELAIKTENGLINGTPIAPFRDSFTIRDKENDVIYFFKTDDYLPRKCSSRLIDSGGVTGWYYVLLHNVQIKQITHGSIIIFKFKDVYGNLHEFSENWRFTDPNKTLHNAKKEYVH